MKKGVTVKKYLEHLKINYRDIDLYNVSMIHPSYQNEHPELPFNNQRFEFLGDAVLDLIVSEYLFLHLKEREGELSRLRAAMVNEGALAKMARKLKIQDHLLLGRGEEGSGGRKRNSTLSDAFEAFMGALFMDLGLDAAREFFLHWFQEDIDLIRQGNGYVDYKSLLQIQAQKEGRSIRYELMESYGPPHDRRFIMGLYLDGQCVAQGEGKSKREAQRQAAKEALGEGA